MKNLPDLKSGTNCRVTWVVGEYAQALKNMFDLDVDTKLHILNSDPGGNVIVCYGGHELAISYDVARQVKVEL